TVTPNSNTNTTASATTQIQPSTGAALSITKTAAASDLVGQNLTYTIVVTNTGTTAAAGTTVTDTLPAGLTFVSATDQTSGMTLTNTGGTITDNIAGSLAAGASETIQIVVTPTAALGGMSVTNTASATFTGGTPVTAMATTSITTILPTHVCYLEGVPGNADITTDITNLYYELLGRAPDPVGLAGWVNYAIGHNNALGDYRIVEGFLNSPEYKTHYITCLYETFLGRAPDPLGLQFWVDKMGNPGTPGGHSGSGDEKYVLAAIVGSDEYYANAGGTAEGFVNAIYKDLLGRAPDADGLNFWMHEVAIRGPADRDGLVRDLLTSPEAAHLLLDMFYSAPGGTSSNPLPSVGQPAGMNGTKLAEVTGGGWENLYLLGPFDSAPEANDAFFYELAAGGRWDDVQFQLLTSYQYYLNSNRPVTVPVV
ncbi:MAG: DUF4214 domain-containing protein, partial [Pirellulales bacterium]